MRARMFACALCGLVSLVGCSSPPAATTYTLAIDPNLSGNFQEAVEQAVFAWTDALDGALTITFEDTCQGVDNEICVWASTSAEIASMNPNEASTEVGMTTWSDHSNTANVYLPADRDNGFNLAFLQLVATHEVGHAMQSQHIADVPGQGENIMFWNADGASKRLSCSDIAQWFWIRQSGSGFNVWTGSTKQCPHGGSFQFDYAHINGG